MFYKVLAQSKKKEMNINETIKLYKALLDEHVDDSDLLGILKLGLSNPHDKVKNIAASYINNIKKAANKEKIILFAFNNQDESSAIAAKSIKHVNNDQIKANLIRIALENRNHPTRIEAIHCIYTIKKIDLRDEIYLLAQKQKNYYVLEAAQNAKGFLPK